MAGLERHGELVDGAGRYSNQVRAELLAMSAASIDRYLRGPGEECVILNRLWYGTITIATIPADPRKVRGK